ncbi:methyltransferase domain-containing protein [Nocardiopsis sp. HNM0947]|uniref:Methyltransferase domain-containing protein n=1 Tax=Nocardiopsis coralli TaxID=2772213 RepID=A0ABR9P9G6_9ACTN|nr:class I SAM-dependent methyltransferase [Nocardiopsis coralli]MBE3000481.1 methyltransferase domain-containing protein [Nocardiopsis coralli]
MSDATYDRNYWEERYSGHGSDHRGGHGHGALEANPHLASETAPLEPGSALDAGCGTGTDALWLAGQGWQVTAVDIAENALETARARAQELGAPVAGRVHWQCEDLTTWQPPAGGYALVYSHYVHTDAPYADLYRRLAAAVAPGGTLLVVGHHPDGLHGDAAHAGHHGTQLTAQQVADLLDAGEWTVETADARVRTATVGDGREITLHDAVLRARRNTGR